MSQKFCILEDNWEVSFFLREAFLLFCSRALSHIQSRGHVTAVALYSQSQKCSNVENTLLFSANTIKSSCNWEEVYYTSSSTPQHFPVSVLRAIFACSPSVHPLLSIDPSWSYHHQKLITFSWQHRPLHLLFLLLDVLI